MSQNLDTGQFVSQPGCPIVFLPTAVAKHRCCESGGDNHHIELHLGDPNLVSNSLMVVLEKTSSMSQRLLFSNCCFWLSIESTSNFVKWLRRKQSLFLCLDLQPNWVIPIQLPIQPVTLQAVAALKGVEAHWKQYLWEMIHRQWHIH